MLDRVWRKGNPLTLLVGMQTSKPLWRTEWRFLKKLEVELPYDPAISLLGIHTEETRTDLFPGASGGAWRLASLLPLFTRPSKGHLHRRLKNPFAEFYDGD